jgi:hypothetical protein
MCIPGSPEQLLVAAMPPKNDRMNMPDGSMLVSDDYNGAVYRVFYGPKSVAGN